MKIEIRDTEYRRLAEDADYRGKAKWSDSILKSYRNKLKVIDNAGDRRDLYAIKSLRLEQLKGKRKHQHSVRLDRQWRLIIEFKKLDSGEVVAIIKIEDYH